MKFWLKIKDWFKRFWRWLIPLTAAAGIGAAVITTPVFIYSDEFNQPISCEQNVRGDWVESTSTLAAYKGQRKNAPCVFWDGKSMDEYSKMELETKIIKQQAKVALNSLVKRAYAALSLNSTTDVVNFGDRFDFEQTSIFSIEWWGSVDATAACENLFVKQAGAAGGRGWFVQTRDCADVGNLYFAIGENSTPTRVACRWDRGGSAIDDGEWHHHAITWNNGTTCSVMTAYVDGISRTLTQLDASSETAGNNCDFTIGDQGTNCAASTPVASQKIDEFRIWNYVRTANLVAKDMWLRIPDQEGLIGYWRMDEGAGKDIFPDTSHASSTNATGTLTSVDWTDSAPINYPE